MRHLAIYLVCLIVLMTSFSAFSASENEKAVGISKGIKVISTVTKFEASSHKITLCQIDSERSNDWACVIDGTPSFGVVSENPANKIDNIKLIVGEKEIKLDTTGMYYGPGSFFLVKHYPQLLLRGCFGDGVATYTAEWLIIKGHSVRTLLKAYEDSPREREWCEKAK